jgi:hypothetical protein
VLRLEGIDINIIPDNKISNRVEIKPRIILSNAADYDVIVFIRISRDLELAL